MTNPLVPRETAALVGEWGEIRKNGLILNPATPYEEWQRIYHTLESIGDGVQWWVGDCLNFGERGYGESYSQVLDPDNGNYQTVANWRWVAGQIELSRRREKLSWSHHAEVAGLEPGQQDALLLAAEEGNWPKGRLRKEAQKIKQGEKLSQPLPEGKYRIIYADPPWEYSGINLENYGPAERHYPTMATDELCELSISTLTAEDAVLFLWATSPMLPDAMRVIEAWGMEYKASIVWNKDAHNYGHYVSVRHEFLLIATCGSCLPDSDKLLPSVVTIKRSRTHSEKPEKFREMIDQMYPMGPRIELFARCRVKGWDLWGNEDV